MPVVPQDSTTASHEGIPARLGQIGTESPRVFWFVGHSRADFESALDLIEALKARHPRVDFLFSSLEPDTRAWLRGRFPQRLVLPPPLPLSPVCNRYLVNLNVRGLALLGALTRGDRAILRAAGRRALPAVLVETPNDPAAASAAALGAVPERLDHHFVLSSVAQTRLLEAGISGERISRLPDNATARCGNFAEVVSDLLVTDLKLVRSKQRPFRRRLERLALRAMDSPRWRRLLSVKVQRIDSVDKLLEELGRPETILCLGNGPTSEDAAVAEIRYDALFRVNHVWQKRGFLTEPDVVFTGSKSTLAALKGFIFGLQSIKSEARLLATRLLQPASGQLRYFTIERFGLYLSEPRWQGVRPTNGATMLATAVALQPARLVVAGIDLFSHPAGTYPGDTATPNAYTPGHHADSELALLLAALSQYQGELTILSPALQEQWKKYQKNGGETARSVLQQG